jgi:hypothetical protein
MQNTFNSYFQHLSAFKMQLNDNVTEQAGMQERINGDHHRELTKLCTTIEARLRNDIASLGHKLDETTGLIDHIYSDVSSQMDHQYTSILNRLDKYYEGSPKLVESQLDMKLIAKASGLGTYDIGPDEADSKIDPSFGPACINPPVICPDETGSASGLTAHSDELFQHIRCLDPIDQFEGWMGGARQDIDSVSL